MNGRSNHTNDWCLPYHTDTLTYHPLRRHPSDPQVSQSDCLFRNPRLYRKSVKSKTERRHFGQPHHFHQLAAFHLHSCSRILPNGYKAQVSGSRYATGTEVHCAYTNLFARDSAYTPLHKLFIVTFPRLLPRHSSLPGSQT